MKAKILHEVPGFYRIIPLIPVRRTSGVYFDRPPLEEIPRIDAVDRVIHERGAISPGPVGEVKRPWYMHPNQDDNLIVLNGTRHVDIFTPEHGLQRFTLTPNQIIQESKIVYDGSAMLVWPRNVFHRIVSGETGSASINFAAYYPGLDMRTNFNIYELDTQTGKYQMIRAGSEDQQF
jgi:hypothetical protein